MSGPNTPSLNATVEMRAFRKVSPMPMPHSMERITAAAQAIQHRFSKVPTEAIILGTGLGQLADQMTIETTIDYADIPGFALSTVESHAGRLLCGTLGGRTVVAMQGRFHRYEGYNLHEVTFPVRVLRALGAGTLIVSNACGGMHPLWARGDVMLIADHINLLGDSPLVGPNDPALGVRFPDMSVAYDLPLRELTRKVAVAQGVTLREGIYIAVVGPNLETRAEYRMLRSLGGDVVGMSTVPEVIVARHGGMRVLGLSIITDMCLPDSLQEATIAEIVASANSAQPKLTALVRGVLESL